MTSLKPCDSSLIKAHGYDLASHTLKLQFHNGKIYEYADVAPEKAARLEAAESIGKFFGTDIRGKHAHTLVDATAEHEGSTAD